MERLTLSEALDLHYQMWKDMRDDLGDEPGFRDREEYKYDWLENHGYEGDGKPFNNCFLCEYVTTCNNCPIDWNYGEEIVYERILACEKGENTWYKSPISKILELPRREIE